MQRSNTGISQVLTVEQTGHDSKVSLHDDHVQHAKEELLDGRTVSATDVAIYLYKNHTFEFKKDGEEPNSDDLLSVFKNEFGYDNTGDFGKLFSTTREENVFEEVAHD
jgi:hypothetical protein